MRFLIPNMKARLLKLTVRKVHRLGSAVSTMSGERFQVGYVTLKGQRVIVFNHHTQDCWLTAQPGQFNIR